MMFLLKTKTFCIKLWNFNTSILFRLSQSPWLCLEVRSINTKQFISADTLPLCPPQHLALNCLKQSWQWLHNRWWWLYIDVVDGASNFNYHIETPCGLKKLLTETLVVMSKCWWMIFRGWPWAGYNLGLFQWQHGLPCTRYQVQQDSTTEVDFE